MEFPRLITGISGTVPSTPRLMKMVIIYFIHDTFRYGKSQSDDDTIM